MRRGPPSRSTRGEADRHARDEKTLEARAREKFDRLLSSPRYERFRGRLIRIFARRGFAVPEDLADETVSRVVAKLPEIVRDYEGAPERYFYGVARNVMHEFARRPPPLPYEENMDVAARGGDEELESAHRCLDRCIDALPRRERELIRGYYLFDRSAKIDHRRALAERLGLGINALRIKAFRVRKRLQRCVTDCLEP